MVGTEYGRIPDMLVFLDEGGAPSMTQGWRSSELIAA